MQHHKIRSSDSDGVGRIDLFDQRWYTIQQDNETEVDVPSVTTILGILDKGYGFQQWLMDVGHNAPAIRDKAGLLGSTVHNLAENTLLGDTVIYDDHSIGWWAWERYMYWCEMYREICKDNKVEFEPDDIEKVVYDLDLGVAGTLDWIPKINGKRKVFDWKTGTLIDRASAELQVIVYAKFFEKITGEEVDEAFIGWIPDQKPNKKGYRIISVPVNDKQYDVFKSQVGLWYWKNGKEKPRFRTYRTEMNMDYINSDKPINLIK